MKILNKQSLISRRLENKQSLISRRLENKQSLISRRFRQIVNKKALHSYHILESWEAGIELLGPEVKSIRAGRVDLGQSFARIESNQVYLVNAHIPAYQNAPIKNYDPTRRRRLLLHRNQTQSLIGKLSGKGRALVLVSVYEKNNLIKVQLGLGKSKKEFDKRRIIKERDHLRRIEQELRGKE